VSICAPSFNFRGTYGQSSKLAKNRGRLGLKGLCDQPYKKFKRAPKYLQKVPFWHFVCENVKAPATTVALLRLGKETKNTNFKNICPNSEVFYNFTFSMMILSSNKSLQSLESGWSIDTEVIGRVLRYHRVAIKKLIPISNMK
jgi:hypothetical protein